MVSTLVKLETEKSPPARSVSKYGPDAVRKAALHAHLAHQPRGEAGAERHVHHLGGELLRARRGGTPGRRCAPGSGSARADPPPPPGRPGRCPRAAAPRRRASARLPRRRTRPGSARPPASGSTAPTTKRRAGRGPKWSSWKRTVSSRVKWADREPGPRDVVAVGVTGPGGPEQRPIGQERRVVDVVGELPEAPLPFGLDLLLGEARHPHQLGQDVEHGREVLGGRGEGDRHLVLAGEEAERGADELDRLVERVRIAVGGAPAEQAHGEVGQAVLAPGVGGGAGREHQAHRHQRDATRSGRR